MKSGSVEMKNVKMSRLMGFTLIGIMFLSLTSGTVMGADEADKRDDKFHVYAIKPQNASKPELEGFKEATPRLELGFAFYRSILPTLEAAIEDHRDNPRQVAEGLFSLLKAKIEFTAEAGKEAEVEQRAKEEIASIIKNISEVKDDVFGGKDRKEGYLALLKKIQDMPFADLKKLIEDKDGLEKFLKEVFKLDEESLTKLGVTLKLAKKDEPKKKSTAEKESEQRTGESNLLKEGAPALGNNLDPQPPANPNPRVGEKDNSALISSLNEMLQNCKDAIAAREREKQDMLNNVLATLNDLKERFLGDEKPQLANQAPPENDLLKKLDQLLGGEEEQPKVADTGTPPPAAQQPQQQSDKRNNQQIPQPMPPQQGGGVPQIALNNTPSMVPAIDTTPAKTPTTGKSALSKATGLAEAVKPISEMEPPAGTTVIAANPNLSPQQNAQNINQYYNDAQTYIDSYKRSMSTSLAMVQSEKQGLAKNKNALSEEIDAQLEKQVPDEFKTAEQTAQQELQQAQSGLKSAEQQAASMMSQVDSQNAGAAQQAASSAVAQANDKITQAQQRLAQVTAAKKDWKNRQGQIDTTLKNRLEKMEQAETDLASRETNLQARLKEVTQIASKNEANRSQALASISTVNPQSGTSNVNAIAGFNGSQSRRGQGLSGVINQSAGGTTGMRAPLTTGGI